MNIVQHILWHQIRQNQINQRFGFCEKDANEDPDVDEPKQSAFLEWIGLICIIAFVAYMLTR